jgi:hypothetical protein
MALSTRRGVLLGAPNEDSEFGSSISSSMAVESKLRSQGDKSASYIVPDDATVDILSSMQMRFRLVPKRWILRHIQLGLVVKFSISFVFWILRSREAIGRRRW